VRSILAYHLLPSCTGPGMCYLCSSCYLCGWACMSVLPVLLQRVRIDSNRTSCAPGYNLELNHMPSQRQNLRLPKWAGANVQPMPAMGKQLYLLQRLPFSVQELVESSPSVTGDGAPVLGSKRTLVHYLSRSTGTVHNTIDPGRGDVILNLPQQKWEAMSGLEVADVLAMGRIKHHVEALNPLSGSVLWNVSHTAWRHMPLPGVEVASEPLLDVSDGVRPYFGSTDCPEQHLLGAPVTYAIAGHRASTSAATLCSGEGHRARSTKRCHSISPQMLSLQLADPVHLCSGLARFAGQQTASRLRAGHHDFTVPDSAALVLGLEQPPDMRMPDESTLSRYAPSDGDAEAPLKESSSLLWTRIFRAPAVYSVLTRSDARLSLPEGGGHGSRVASGNALPETPSLPLPFDSRALESGGDVEESPRREQLSQRGWARRPVSVGRVGGGGMYAMPVSRAQAGASRKGGSYAERAAQVRGEVVAGGRLSVVMQTAQEHEFAGDIMCPVGVPLFLRFLVFCLV
jgi:hypothetical protein